MNSHVDVAFFDIGETLASAHLSPPPPPLKLEKLTVYSYVPDVLNELKADGVRCGIISNIGNDTEENVKAVLKASGLDPAHFFDAPLVFKPKDSKETFEEAAARANSTPARCLFVGEDKNERSYAREAGFQVTPHPQLAWEVCQGGLLRYFRVSVPPATTEDEWHQLMHDHRVMPLDVTGEKGMVIYAICSTTAALQLVDHGFKEVARLGGKNTPDTTDVYRFRDNRPTDAGFMLSRGQASSIFRKDNPAFRASTTAAGFVSARNDASEQADPSDWILSSTEDELYVAIPAGYSVEDFHFERTQHGHTEKLIPSMALLVAGASQRPSFLPLALSPPRLSENDISILRNVTSEVITGELIRQHVRRYSGAAPLDPATATSINSRHIQNPFNRDAVEWLQRDLLSIGAQRVGVHPFIHEGQELYNVVAEIIGDDPAPGTAPQVVLVTAHLDSTAANDSNYKPREDPAPGADDDASGIAAVLAVAQVIKRLRDERRPLKRTVRFVLFNAEEHGLVGSKYYARAQALAGDPIIAVYQMDMIGYNLDPPTDVEARRWEVHAGFSISPDVQDRSLALAEIIKLVASHVSPTLPLPQLYKHTDVAHPDRAEGRSDHASFHRVGYAACVTSADFFPGDSETTPLPAPEGNPHYHSGSDTASDVLAERSVDFSYAADIARAIAAAAWVTANA